MTDSADGLGPRHEPPEADLAALVSRELGDLGAWREIGSNEGGTRSFKVERPSRVPLVVRTHRSSRKFEREKAAHERWGLELGERVAQLVLADETRLLLVLSWIPGRQVGPELSRDERTLACFRAGRFLRDLQAVPFRDTDGTPVADALAMRMSRALAEAKAALPASRLSRFERAFHDPALFAGLTRVPCHRDFEARNWIVVDGQSDEGSDEGLAVIDFEHAGPDVWLSDLVKLSLGSLRDEPALMRKLLEGLGQPDGRLSAVDVERLWALQALHGVGTVAWGLRNGSESTVAEGSAVLNFLMEDGSRGRA